MSDANVAFEEPVHIGADWELAGFPCHINPYEVNVFLFIYYYLENVF